MRLPSNWSFRNPFVSGESDKGNGSGGSGALGPWTAAGLDWNGTVCSVDPLTGPHPDNAIRDLDMVIISRTSRHGSTRLARSYFQKWSLASAAASTRKESDRDQVSAPLLPSTFGAIPDLVRSSRTGEGIFPIMTPPARHRRAGGALHRGFCAQCSP